MNNFTSPIGVKINTGCDIPIKVNYEHLWYNPDFTVNAARLFRMRLVEPDDYYTFKGHTGVITIRLFRTTADELEFRDIAIRVATVSPQDLTPKIIVQDLDKRWALNLTYKIKLMDDGYAYFLVKGINKNDYVTFQVMSQSYNFVEVLADSVPLTEYNDDVTNVVAVIAPKAISFEMDAITYANGVQANTNTVKRSLNVRVVDGAYIHLQDWIYNSSEIPAGGTLFTLSKKPLSKDNDFFVDCASTSDLTTATLTRIPVRWLYATGEVITVNTLPLGCSVRFDACLGYRTMK